MKRWLVLFAMASCVEGSVTPCNDGRICPAARRCDDVHRLCVTEDQLTTCVGVDDGQPCMLDDGRIGECDAAVCILQTCGDGLVTGNEECDGDAVGDCQDLGYYDSAPLVCSPRCLWDPLHPESTCTGTCGDGMRNGAVGVEVCDGAPPSGATCLDYGFEWGRLGCDEFCAPGFSGCRDIGFQPVIQTNGRNFTAIRVLASDHMLLGESPNIASIMPAVIEIEGSSVTTHSIVTDPDDVWGDGTHIFAVGDVNQSGPQASISHFDGATWTTSQVTGQRLFGVWGTSANNVYAVGHLDRIYRFDGASWSLVAGPGTWDLYGVHGSSATSIWAVGVQGIVRHGDGTTWTSVDASACWSGNPAPHLFDVWSSSPTDVFAVGAGGIICHYDGVSWKRHASGTTEFLHGVWGLSSDNVFAVGRGGVVLHYDGAMWWRLDSGLDVQWLGVDGLGDDVLIAGVNGVLRRYAGAALSPVPLDGSVTSLAFPTPDLAFAVYSGALHKRVGSSWQVVRTPLDTFNPALYVAPDGMIFLGDSDAGGTMHRFDGNSTWTTEPAPFDLSAMTGRASNDVYAFGASSIAHYNGTNWTPMTSNTTSFLFDASITSTEVFALGLGPTVIRYRNGVWAELPLPAGVPYLSGIWAAPNGHVFVVGNDGVILRHDGTSWSSMTSGVGSSLYKVSGTSESDVFAVGIAGVLHYDGTSWTPVGVPSMSQYIHVIATPKNVLMIGGASSSALVRSGLTW